MTRDEVVAARWQRRYAGRRWIMGVPVSPERNGTLIDSYVVFDIACRRFVHALRPDAYRVLRLIAKVTHG